MAHQHIDDHPPHDVDGHAQRHKHNHDCADENVEVHSTAMDSREAKLAFKVIGLDCAEEVAVLRQEVGPLVGGEENLAFDVLNGRMMILEDARSASASEIQEAIRRTGMTAEEWQPGQNDFAEDGNRRLLQVWFTTLSGLGVLTGIAMHIWLAGGIFSAFRLFGGHDGQFMPWPEIVAYALAIGFGVRFVVPKAWFALKRLRPDINLLMVIAVAGAITIGEWFEAATVAFLFALSLALESWSIGRARRAISALLDLAPPTVRVREDSGIEKEMLAEDVLVGAHFVVKPGERIPLDGRVVAGISDVNQAPITGESLPVQKDVDAEVFAGCINGDGALEIESTKAAQDTMLARIIRLVEEAHSRRAMAEQWVEKFARIYTPAVILLAIAVFIVPPLAFGGVWEEWFYRALVLLVIACPCALVISTPVSIVAALAASARQGVLVKGGVFIEQPARLNALAFDKTGTVTRGEPAVVYVIPLNNHSEWELLERAAALEARSAHPLARAVSEYAAGNAISVEPADDVQNLPGQGVIGTFQGESFWLGSHRYLVARGQDSQEVTERATALEREGKTVVAIGNDRHVCGLLAFADTLRPGAAETLQELRRLGVEHLVMLTGDNRVTAETIAGELDIDEVHAELLPQEKVTVVERLVEEYGNVAMVGDGVNDAPAMARASFGIAMGAAGSDAAIETADIALMTDDLTKLPWIVSHSRRTLAIIRQNVVFSLAVKAIFVVLTFIGFATLWGAIAADVGASLLVVVNALRLLRPGQTRRAWNEHVSTVVERHAAKEMSHGH